MLKVSTKEMDLLAQDLWGRKAKDMLQESVAIGVGEPTYFHAECEGYEFTTTEDSDYVTYVHNGYEGEFLK